METYKEFLDRISAFETEEMSLGDAYFTGSAVLRQRVDENNRLKTFCGDTTVFNLDDAAKEQLARIVDRLYAAVPECFCERLIPATFHMTLHDLSNSPCLKDIAVEVFENELKVVKKAAELKHHTILMRSKAIFNMTSTSLVLGLYPANEDEYRKLMELYHAMDDVKKLSYPLTPHITLAYYNINGFDTASVRKLEAIVRELNQTEMTFTLDTRNLYYQKFISMNEYINIIHLAGRTED